MSAFSHLSSDWPGMLAALVQIIVIDLTLAGDNAVAVGLAAADLPREKRRWAIILGMAASAVMLCSFAWVASDLLEVLGLRLAGGALLLWVCWRMWADLRFRSTSAERHRVFGEKPPKSLVQALVQILATDLSMSLDNVLAIAGAARHQPKPVLIFGLALSIVLTGLAASAIARLIRRAPWIAYVGLAIVALVACQMIWDGSIQMKAKLAG